MRYMKRKINVLQVIPSLFIGGAERVVHSLASFCDPGMFNVRVCCIRGMGDIAEELAQTGIDVFQLSKFARYNSKYLNFLNLNNVLSHCKPDIVHTHCTGSLLDIGPLYFLKKAAPLVHTFHFGNYPHIEKKYLYAERLFAKRATRLVSVSESQRSSLIDCLRLNPLSIETVFNGVSENPFIEDRNAKRDARAELGFNEDDLIIGAVAVLSVQKGIAHLLDAAVDVMKARPRVKFLIVGGGPLLDSLRDKARALGISGKVHFTGWRRDAQKLLTVLDIFVSSSLWEGLPLAILEAMAAKKAIIATTVGDNTSLISDHSTGLLIPKADPGALAKSMIELIDDQALRARLGQNAYCFFSANFSIKKMVDSYEKIYIKTTEGRL